MLAIHGQQFQVQFENYLSNVAILATLAILAILANLANLASLANMPNFATMATFPKCGYNIYNGNISRMWRFGLFWLFCF